jgi:hypothetical protein
MEQEDGLGALHNFAKKHDERAAEWLQRIEDMLGDYETYGWAEDTLIGIYDHIMNTNSITDKQIQAVENIRDAKNNRRW